MPKRPQHHPPAIAEYEQPRNKHPAYIGPGPQGFGYASYFVAQIPCRLAREVIVRHHYSGRFVNNSYLHLGVYLDGVMVGVLQFGYALNPARVGHIVDGTGKGEYLELNRMWLSDDAPRNSESRAIAYAVRYIRRAMPKVAWIQSFADERCGGLGVVYQAANFIFCGSMKSEFLELDGEYYHRILVTAHRKGGARGRHLRENLHRAVLHRFRQFRYIFFVKKGWRKRLCMPVLPYPKPGEDNRAG